jgi:D-sedoheptulose 7-phosphate isomerase
VKKGRAELRGAVRKTIGSHLVEREASIVKFMSEVPKKITSTEELVESYLARIKRSLSKLEFSSIHSLVDELVVARAQGATVFIAGNGGSASTSGHFAIDWMLGSHLAKPPLRVISLSESSASITATGNDVAFDEVFSRQLRTLAKKQDLLLAISASGNSPNILSLVNTAREMQLRVLGITGFDGGELINQVDVSVHVPTEKGDYGVAEDIHLMIGHIVKEALMARINHGI